MNLNQLRVFATVAAEGSITRAARRLKISQPAVSKQLAELEDHLEVRLFDRLPRGVRLTAAGESLHRHSLRIFAAEEAAEAELAELKGLSRGRLRVGASTTIGSYLVPTLFGEYHRRHPGVLLELEIANTRAIEADVVEGRLDLGLTEGMSTNDQLEAAVFAEDAMVAIIAPGHPLLSRTPLKVADLVTVPFLTRERGSGTRAVVEAALEEVGLELEPAMSLGSTEALKNAVAARLGLAIVSQLAVELELKTGRLVAVPVGDLSIRRELHLVQLRGKQPSRTVEAFLALLRHPRARHGPGDYSI